ncbi:MAG: redoxin family protein [Pseudomonadota bacterium]
MVSTRASLTLLTILVAAIPLGLSGVSASDRARSGKTPVELPEFTQTAESAWINGGPLVRSDLAGRVTLVDIWTFECWNCYRSIPWLKTLESQFDAEDFGIVGIHTPEFEHEKDRGRVLSKAAEFGVTHPVMLDNDFGYWRALNNRYWPAFYIVDRKGRIRGRFVGETHAGDKRAQSIEALIAELIAEPA